MFDANWIVQYFPGQDLWFFRHLSWCRKPENACLNLSLPSSQTPPKIHLKDALLASAQACGKRALICVSRRRKEVEAWSYWDQFGDLQNAFSRIGLVRFGCCNKICWAILTKQYYDTVVVDWIHRDKYIHFPVSVSRCLKEESKHAGWCWLRTFWGIYGCCWEDGPWCWHCS